MCICSQAHMCTHPVCKQYSWDLCYHSIHLHEMVDFPMAMSEGQSMVRHHSPKGPASPADPPRTDLWVTQSASLKPLLRRVRPYSVLILVDNLVPWKSEGQNEAVLTRSLPQKSGQPLSGGFGENKEGGRNGMQSMLWAERGRRQGAWAPHCLSHRPWSAPLPKPLSLGCQWARRMLESHNAIQATV